MIAAAVAFSLSVAVQTSFAWAIRRFFVAAEGVQPGMRAIARLGAVSAAAQLVVLAFSVATPPPTAFAVSGALSLLGAMLLFWSAVAANLTRPLTPPFSEDLPEHVVTWGPYRWIRHPFYAAYLLAWLGGAVAGAQPALLLSVAVMGALYVRAARLEEAKFRVSTVALAYSAYRARTGMILPRPCRARAQGQLCVTPGVGTKT